MVLWNELRGRRLDGMKFRRQHPLGPYVVDFCCVERRLIVEVDGEVHEQQREYDDSRSEYLSAISYRVIRFTNEQIANDLGSVLTTIREAALASKPLAKNPTQHRPVSRGAGSTATSR
jgi:5-methyltetrahydrofolate--homocysteine methyltransferase